MEETQRQVTRIVVFLSTFYFLLIALEIFWSHRQRRKLYTLRETLASLGTGIFYQALSSTVPMAAKIFFLNIAYAYAPVKWSLGWVHFGIAFLLADLFYYLQHRLNHSSDFFWAFHSAHHSSQEFNLMTGVRVSWVMPLFSAFFFMPLAFLGIDPNYIMISLALIFYGQWWCHTVYVGKLGWAEKIINTPSSHRVHHHPDGSISRANYAGLLIVWDRLFGTYRAEPGFIRQFGTDDGFVGHNPFVINLRGFAAYVARRIRPASAACKAEEPSTLETDTLTGSPDLNLVGDDEKRRYSLMSYYRLDSDDVFEKCRRFRENYDAMNEDGKLSDSLRVSLDSGLDHRSSVTDRETGRRREVVCFDSNGYLGLQHHPSVKAAVIAAVHEFGAGTPSVPLLGGTNRIVRELEKTVAAFHGREDALIFSSAYAANIGVMPALLRRGDVVLHDQCVHASILQGIRLSKNKASIEFAFNDPADLESKLQALKAEGHDGGTLVVADGVYSMHGDVLRLPEMRAVCDLYGARLIVDECHSVGVLGPRGRGVEDFYSTPGSCDLIVGCFSKALGFSGGYVTGPADVVSFLRFFGNSYVFSASLPSPLCAGILEGFRVIDREPQWLEQLRVNARYLKERVRELGVEAPAGESSIVKIPIEGNKRLFKIGAELLANGLKCGVVTFPAVRDHRGLLRLVVTARHTRRDIDEAVDILGRTLRRYGLLSR